MADDKLTRVLCQKCGRKIGVRSDQFGRRLRCPACQTAFRVDPPSTALAQRAPTAPPPSAPGTDPSDELPADEAGELARAAPPRRSAPAAASARFAQPPNVVFEATALAVRRAGAEVLSLDRANLHIRFARAGGPGTEHTAYVFPGPTGGSELDIRSSGPTSREDELLYGRIAAEIVAYLEAHNAHARAEIRSIPSPLPSPPSRRRRKRRPDPVDGLAIGGLVASTIGLAVFCVPIASVPLGAVGATLSLIALLQRKGNRGLAIAGLVIGLVAIVVSGLFFLVLFTAEIQEQERQRNQFGAAWLAQSGRSQGGQKRL